MDQRQVWRATLGELEISLSQATFETWFRRTALIRVDEASSTFVLGVASGFAKDWVEERYRSLIAQTIAKIVGYSVTLTVEVVSEAELDAHGALGSRSKSLPTTSSLTAESGAGVGASASRSGDAVRIVDASEPTRPTNLNARYTFATYVVGSGTRLAHAASQSVSERPGGAYNPLFLYGGTGLGKTHLLHAIGNAVMERSPKRRVLYITGEAFTNEFILGIQQGAADAFRSRFRKIDVLLIDDIQFIADKERTQEEFFHTFNALHSAGKQIVITSDRTPKEISLLEERLRSRFEWGLIADISSPDLETRIAILRSKAEESGVIVADDVVEQVARRVQSNVRELEGALTRLVAVGRLSGMPVTMELAARVLSEAVYPNPKRILEPEQVVSVVAEHFGLTVEQLRGPKRDREIVVPRQIAAYLSREETDASLVRIGGALGGRDHSTIIHGCAKIEREMSYDAELRREVALLREALLRLGRGVASAN
ncbi:MAG: chromosomal replication initiator protein DnaA [Chloroflexi bacterium]|jgi:chromosomal replication initiator protein|nr:chromosomal replication initiator protein DnaA [Chloroflexota bacterium]